MGGRIFNFRKSILDDLLERGIFLHLEFYLGFRWIFVALKKCSGKITGAKKKDQPRKNMVEKKLKTCFPDQIKPCSLDPVCSLEHTCMRLVK